MKKIYLLILSLLCCSLLFSQSILQVGTSISRNDVEINSNTNTVNFTSSDLELHGKDGTTPQETFVRFDGITLPSDAVINQVYLIFTGNEAGSTGTVIDIRGEVGNSASYPTSTAASTGIAIKGRSYTSDLVSWTTSTCVVNQKYQSPDLKGLVTEMFPGGLQGADNVSMAFRLTGNGQGSFNVYSRDGGVNYQPQLVIGYWTGKGSSTVLVTELNNDAQENLATGAMSLTGSSLHLGGVNGTAPVTNGIKFDNVKLPDDAQITDAYIEFYSYGTASKEAQLTFRTELGNAAIYNTTNKNITSRAYSQRSVTWNTDAWPRASVLYRTPNLKEIIDENRLSGWKDGQSLAFRINGDGIPANVYSRNGSSTYQPRLVIEYLNNGQGPNVGPLPETFTFVTYVTHSANNASQNKLTGSTTLNLQPMSLSGGTNSAPVTTAVKFDDIQLPEDATITDAYIQFHTYGASSSIGSDPIVIHSEIGNPAVYAATVNNLTARQYSSNQVIMSSNPEGFPLATAKPFRTPNLQTIIDESRLAGWQSGQSLAFRFESLPETASALGVYSRSSELNQPQLIITYKRGGGPVKQSPPIVSDGVVQYYKGAVARNNVANENKNTGSVTLNGTINFTTAATSYINGIRFENVQIPEGTRVESAWIELYSSTRNSAKIKISGELGNAPAYTATSKNVTQRNYTTVFEEWEAVAVTASPYSYYNTPDLKNIINQNILNGTWQSGQALAFKFETLSGGAIAIIGDAGQYQPRLKMILSAGEPTIDIVTEPERITNLYINEIAPVGSSAQTEDWIELYNGNDYPIYFSENSNVYVSTKNANLSASKLAKLNNLYIPAHGFLVLVADENPALGSDHLSFDLGNSGTDVYLFKMVGGASVILDQATYPAIPYNSSYGRVADGAGSHVIFIQPTFNAPNAGGKQFIATTFSKERGVYPTGFDLTINVPQGTTVKYTLDGQYPSETVGTVYTAPIPITKTTVVKTYAYNSVGNSGVIANTYVLLDNYANEQTGSYYQWQYKNNVTAAEYAQALSQIPIVSLSANPGRSTTLLNYQPFTLNWQEASVEYLDKHVYPNNNDHANFFSNSHTKKFGQVSSSWFNCGLKFKFNKDAGVKNPSYPFFDPYEGDAYGTPTKTTVIELKEGEDGAQSNIWNLGYMRFSEKIVMNLQKQMGKYALDTRWIHLFVNGQYRGLKTMRNDFNSKNVEELFGDNDDNYTLVTLQDGTFTSGVVEAGDGLQSVWNSIVSLSTANNLQGFKEKVDLNDLIKFQIMFMFIDCENEAEALVHNEAPKYSKAMFNINDIDGAFFGGVQPGPSANTAMSSRILAGGGGNYKYKWISNSTSRRGPNGFFGRFSGLASQPMDTIARVNETAGNLEFKTLVKDQVLKNIGPASGDFQGADGAPLSVANVQKEITKAVAELDLIYKLDAAYMSGKPANGSVNGATRYNDWKNIDYPRILAQVPERVSFNLKYWRHFGLAHTLDAVTINTGQTIVPDGEITMTNPNANTQLYYTTDGSDPMGNDGIVSPKALLYSNGFALPPGNYTLVARAFTTNNWGPVSYKAVTVSGPGAGQFVISGINYKPKSNGDAEFVLITNAGNEALDVSGYTVSDAFKHTFPQGTSIPAGETIMLAKNLDLIIGFNAMTKYQWTSGSLANEGEPITFSDASGNVADHVYYLPASPWNALANGQGYYLALKSTDLDNSLAESWDAELIPEVDTSSGSSFIISGINYKPKSNGDAEFVLITNAGNEALDVSGYTVSNAFKHTFPQGTSIPAGETIMLAKNLDLIIGFSSMTKYQWTSGSLANEGEPITFFDASGVEVDHVYYLPTSPWDALANGQGYYLALKNVGLDNSLAESWEAALIPEVDTPPAPSVQFVISGINYKPKSSGDAEFVLITNAGNEALDVSGYTVSNAFKHTFPQGTSIPAGETIMLAKDLSLIIGFSSMTKYQWTSGSLANEGEPITFFDASGAEVDHVYYLPASPWDALANGQGYYLALKNVGLDNSLAESWEAALLPEVNAASPSTVADASRTTLLDEMDDTQFIMYPNPVSSELHIDIDNNPADSKTLLYIYNAAGALEITKALDGDKNIVNVSYLSPGYHLVKVVNDKGTTKTFRLIKL